MRPNPMPLDSHWTTNFDDVDLTFWISVYRNFEQAAGCLQRLRDHFIDARVIIRSDGDADPRLGKLAERYQAAYYQERRLFPVQHGGAIITRMLEMFLKSPSGYLVKIDPDTAIHRRFRFLPAGDGVFGTPQGGPHYRSIQGGCLGMNWMTASRLCESGLLACEDLKQPDSRRDESGFWRVMARRAERCGLASFDWAIGWACQQLEIPLIEFPEVYCTWRTATANDDLRYAVTHPTAITTSSIERERSSQSEDSA